MKITRSEDGTMIPYLTREDVKNLSKAEREMYTALYCMADQICESLDIKCPDITIHPYIERRINNCKHITGGVFYKITECNPKPSNNILILSVLSDINESYNEKKHANRLLGTLAHELRHIWQDKHPEIFASDKHACGFDDSLYDDKEIDADGYAIYYLNVNKKLSIKEAANLMCPEESKNNRDAFQKRINVAKQLRRSNNLMKLRNKIILHVGKKISV